MAIIRLQTNSREYKLDAPAGESLLESLRKAGLPAYAIIARDANNNFCPLDRINGPAETITAYSIRNLDFGYAIPRYAILENANAIVDVFHPVGSPGRLALHQLSREDALRSIRESFDFVLDRYSETQKGAAGPGGFVIALSAGGDSRVLAECAAAYRQAHPESEFLAVTCSVGIEDDTAHLNAARRIAKEFALTHMVLSGTETAAHLGFGVDISTVGESFLRDFPTDEPEILGTYFVQEVMRSVATDRGWRGVIMGYNLEDAVADRLYQVISDRLLPAFPIRRLDDFDVLAPLYRTPKRVLDSLDVDNSLRNYGLRRPSVSYLRSTLYFLACHICERAPEVAHLLAGAGLKGNDPDEINRWLRQFDDSHSIRAAQEP